MGKGGEFGVEMPSGFIDSLDLLLRPVKGVQSKFDQTETIVCLLSLCKAYRAAANATDATNVVEVALYSVLVRTAIDSLDGGNAPGNLSKVTQALDSLGGAWRA